MRIKDIPEYDRPRERFAKLGASSLSDAEVLALILQKGTRGENVISVAHRLLAKNSLHALSRLSLKELQTVNGIGPAKAMQIKAAFELTRRVKDAHQKGRAVMCARDVYKYTAPRIANLDHEVFMVLQLDSKNRIVNDEMVSVGTLNASLIHPREVFKSAIKESANAVIVVHNHPSGDPQPSPEDEEITKRLIDAGELLDIRVLDHVIVGRGRWWSHQERQE